MAGVQAGFVGGAKVAVTQPVTNPTTPVALVVVMGDGEGNLLGNFDGASTQVVTVGGKTNVPIAAGAVANTVVKASAGRLCRVLLTSANGAAAVTFYDNASTASGTVIGYIPASAAVGSLYDFQMPAALGITVGGASTNPAMTVSFV